MDLPDIKQNTIKLNYNQQKTNKN